MSPWESHLLLSLGSNSLLPRSTLTVRGPSVVPQRGACGPRAQLVVLAGLRAVLRAASEASSLPAYDSALEQPASVEASDTSSGRENHGFEGSCPTGSRPGGGDGRSDDGAKSPATCLWAKFEVPGIVDLDHSEA
eukprot:CAMPEP_0115088248 /NCGR_PEP_ID=MMETSP0227-20121206/23864_1 /TAXON_ID=89957 /ORGANISM="Polarella glacialis, Strain CCMP 1383" /LENGTH=134 /DNA_ID=CAMNT_0002478453 /DNA_START=234 /DNA_END=638 /DNA_ORIENTATION=+